MSYPDPLNQTLEQVFRRIQQQRMRGVPILNQALRVEAVEFTHWQGDYLGVLITPWFMNLMLLPNEGDEWEELVIGKKVTQVFPSGAYEFIVGYEQGIGRYQTCSLFSPLFEFSDQEMAVAMAKAVMLGLMDQENRDQTSMREQEIARIWCEPEKVEPSEQAVLKTATLEQRLEQPLSRRDLLRGHILRELSCGSKGV